MGLLAELGFDGGVNIAEAEKQAEGFSLPPEGIHHAILEGASTAPDGQSWHLTFKIIAGPAEGMTVKETVWKPKGDDEKKDKTTRSRAALFAHRLGLLKKVVKDGVEVGVEVEGKHDFCDCYGAACFIDVKHKPSPKKVNGVVVNDALGKPVMMVWPVLSFEGVLKPDDKRVKDVPKAAKIPAVSAGAVGGGKPADNFGDL